MSGFGTSAEMYFDTTLQKAFSRGRKCHPKDMSKTCKFVRLIAKYLHEDNKAFFTERRRTWLEYFAKLMTRRFRSMTC